MSIRATSNLSVMESLGSASHSLVPILNHPKKVLYALLQSGSNSRKQQFAMQTLPTVEIHCIYIARLKTIHKQLLVHFLLLALFPQRPFQGHSFFSNPGICLLVSSSAEFTYLSASLDLRISSFLSPSSANNTLGT